MIFLLELNCQNLTDQISTQILLNELIESVGLVNNIQMCNYLKYFYNANNSKIGKNVFY